MTDSPPDTEPLAAIAPDWNGFLRALRRQGTPRRVHYFEHGIADNVLATLAERFDLWRGPAPGDPARDLERRLAVHRHLGHELFRVFPPGARMVAPKLDGEWAQEGKGVVTSWEEFESFAWQRSSDADFSVMQRLDSIRPDDMMAFHVLDIWEVVRELVGFESLCYALFDEPELVQAVFDRVGAFAEDILRALCDFDTFGALYIADDLGHKTGLMIHPDEIRKYVLPWHKRLATIAHDKGKLCFLHSCGNMYELMDEYIDEIGIDAKHSFEDNVVPVEEVKRRFGDRLTLLGGIDVDLLARGSAEAIRERTRTVLDACHPGGGYFLGSGNWVTAYIPPESYCIMLDEARRYQAGG